jgi:hypothetical protein
MTVDVGIARSSAQYVGWGSFLFDFDNDGDLDLFKANADLSRLFGQEDQMFENVGGGKFNDVSERLGPYFHRELMGRGACYGDYDGDGDLDILIVNLNSPPVLLRNDGGNRNHWLSFSLVGRHSNRDALGAKVTLTAGGKTQIAERRSASGYLSQNAPHLHFGLGANRSAERIEILWPSGAKKVLQNVAANQMLVVEEP